MSSFTQKIVRLLAAPAALWLAALAAPAARADEAPCAPPPPPPCPCSDKPSWCEPPPEGCPCPTYCIPNPLVRVPCFDDCVDQFEKGKAASCLKIGAGAYHWWNYHPKDGKFTYGYPGGGEGTYFYYFTGDVDLSHCASPCQPTFGGHVELRARDDTVFRSFFDQKVWFYEAYAWADFHDWGKVKAGKVWKRFGLDWDGTFWGNVPYYDGFKLDPDYGVSWENTWNKGKRVSIDTFAQYFAEEDRVNGSLAGADPESVRSFREQNTFVARAVPTYHIDSNTSVALGLSGLVGTVAHSSGTGSDETIDAYAADLTVQWCGLKVFGEWMRADGELNPAYYVTGGPTDKRTDWMAGAQYKIGPFTPRVVYSYGNYDNPGGHQSLFLAGGTVEITQWLTLYVEYVNWDVKADGASNVKYEDGWQFVLAWHF